MKQILTIVLIFVCWGCTVEIHDAVQDIQHKIQAHPYTQPIYYQEMEYYAYKDENGQTILCTSQYQFSQYAKEDDRLPRDFPDTQEEETE